MPQKGSIRSILGNILYPIFMFYLIQLIVYYLLAFIFDDISDMSLTLQFCACLAVTPYMLYLYKKHLFYRWIHKDDFKSRIRPVNLILCAVFGIFVAVFLNNLFNMIGLASVAGSYTEVENSFFTGRLIFELIALGIVTPAAEELMYRGVLFYYLKRTVKPVYAYLVSAFVFGLIHMNLVQFLYAFIFGLFLCLFADKLDTVLAPIIIHAAANLTSVISKELGIATMTGHLIYDCVILAILAVASGTIIRYIIQKM